MPTLKTTGRFWQEVEEGLGGPVSAELRKRSFDRTLAEQYAEALSDGRRDGQKKTIAAQARLVQEEVAAFAPFAARLSSRRRGSAILDTAQSTARPPDTARAVVTLSAAEQHRAWLFQDHLARVALNHYRHLVAEFRQDELGDQTLSPADARQWLRSPLAALQSRYFLYDRGLSALTTPAVVVSRDRARDRLVIDVDGQRVTCRRRHNQPAMFFIAPDGERFEFWESSLVSKLVQRGAALARVLPWTDTDAAWFILTGIAPAVPPLQGEFTRGSQRGEWRRGVLRIDVEPWISEDTLLATYRDLRQQVMLDSARLPARALAAWQFMEDQRSGKPPGYAECFRRWNKQHPERPYSDYRQFRRDVRRGEQNASLVTKIVLPQYRLKSDAAASSGVVNSPSFDRNLDRNKGEQ